ncbi:hypothetical protein ACTFIT_009535 [Dictyostelium discoideum]
MKTEKKNYLELKKKS